MNAASDHNINLEKSIFYGDKASDVQAARAAGCKSVILIHDEDAPEKIAEAKSAKADYKVNSHTEAAEIISQLQRT